MCRRPTTPPAPTAGAAGRQGRRAAHIDLHPPWVPEITGGQMAVVWRDFSKTATGQNPIDPSLQDEMSFLDMSLPEGPVIYLNERVPGLRRLLDVRIGRTGIERAARETALDLVAVPAIVSLLNVALAAAGPLQEEEAAQWPDGWERDVLRGLLPLMYPDRDPEVALGVALRALTSGEDAQDVQSRALGAASRLVKATNHMRGVITTLEEAGRNQDQEQAHRTRHVTGAAV
jgi:hypothetical protein